MRKEATALQEKAYRTLQSY
uniref:Uncharacterized protein n=1 Tax=Anguilla anguilla TaxID=7936 RepID=A0A0E9PHA1_ANGAN